MQREEMEPYWMQWILCSMMECSGFNAAWPKASRLNAVDYMQHHWLQRISCNLVQWIPIVFSGVDAARPKPPWLNAVDSMHCDWLQWIPCSVVKCIPINAVDSMQRVRIQLIPCSVKKWNPIECRGFHAAWWNAVHFMQHGPMHPDWMQWILCSMAQSISIECVDSIHCDWIQCTPCSVVKCIPIECSGVYAVWRNGTHWM